MKVRNTAGMVYQVLLPPMMRPKTLYPGQWEELPDLYGKSAEYRMLLEKGWIEEEEAPKKVLPLKKEELSETPPQKRRRRKKKAKEE